MIAKCAQRMHINKKKTRCVRAVSKKLHTIFFVSRKCPQFSRSVILRHFTFNDVKIKAGAQFVYRVIDFDFLHMENHSHEHQGMLNLLSPINEGYGGNVCLTESH
jgi:hypothetical protein